MSERSRRTTASVRVIAIAALLLVPVVWRHIGIGEAAAMPSRAATAQDTLRFVAHPQNLPVGWPSVDRPLALRNPLGNDARALATGAKLYVAYNCVDCHGAGGGGSMGPSLNDGRWHFGGSDGEIFESIYQGRPEGMPAWGGRIANDQIWMLVAYLRSLHDGHDVSTENFTGRTVERTGH